MKKFLAILLAVMMIFAVASCGGKKIPMGTGGTSGTYYQYGGILAKQIKDATGLNVVHVTTGGSKANIEGIDKGDYMLGTVQSDVMAYAWNGERTFSEAKVASFRTVAGLYAETVQLVTMDPSIKSVADLKGKSVSIGAQGSGVYFNAIDALTAAGLTEEDIKPQYLSFDESADSLKNKKIDAAFVVAGAPTPAITELCTSTSAWLVPIDGEIAEKMMAANAFYSVLEIPANTYKGQDKAVKTVTVKATLIASETMSEDDVYNLTKAIFDNAADISHPKSAELSLENAVEGLTVVPFHAGAVKYFTEKGVEFTEEGLPVVEAKEEVKPEDEATEGEATEDEATEGEATEGEAAEGEATEGETAEGETAEGEAAEGEAQPE